MATESAPAMSGQPGKGRQAALLLRTLLLLTAVTGIVDAVSYLLLGHVFVANMTGNVVFLGFALGGAHGLSISASLAALGSFLFGAVLGGRLGVQLGKHRGRLLAGGVTGTAVLVAAGLLVAAFVSRPLPAAARYALIVLLAVGMGVQNATSRRLAVADATTTVLTLTLTGLAADSPLAGGANPRPWRRIASVLAMLAGALAGALLIRWLDLRVALALALVLLVGAGYVIRRRSARTPAHEWAPAG